MHEQFMKQYSWLNACFHTMQTALVLTKIESSQYINVLSTCKLFCFVPANHPVVKWICLELWMAMLGIIFLLGRVSGKSIMNKRIE